MIDSWRFVSYIIVATLVALGVGGAAFASDDHDDDGARRHPSGNNYISEQEEEMLARRGGGELTLLCSLERPSQVQRYFLRCADATELDVRIEDCCVPGDHWEAKVKSWDEKPNTAVTTSPGPAGMPGVKARVYTYGGPPENPSELRATIECTYLHGVNIFPAGSFLSVQPDSGSCSVQVLDIEDEISRRP